MSGQEGFSESESSGRAGNVVPSITTGFRIGLSSQSPSAGDGKAAKVARRRPPSWKRKAQAGKASSKITSSSGHARTTFESSSKRKPDSVPMSPAKKILTPTNNSVASSLKSLLPQ